ncbi:hypothetical protein MMC10_000942 [Thelotrema lepadinum]|nr:hypothetical protein [Thelotrema lepadinum]
MSWLVPRYSSAPGQLIVLGSILYDPEEPESCLNRHQIKEIDPKHIHDESAALQRAIQTEKPNDYASLLKIAQPLLDAALGVGGKPSKDRKLFVDEMDVTAKSFLPDREYMDASVEVPCVQQYVKECYFSKTLYIIVGVASARKLGTEEVTSQGSGTEAAADSQHGVSKKAVSGLKFEEVCDFAYRVRKFTYRKLRKNKVKTKGDWSEGALFRATDNDDEEDDDDDNDSEDEYLAGFNDLEDSDVAGSST